MTVGGWWCKRDFLVRDSVILFGPLVWLERRSGLSNLPRGCEILKLTEGLTESLSPIYTATVAGGKVRWASSTIGTDTSSARSLGGNEDVFGVHRQDGGMVDVHPIHMKGSLRGLMHWWCPDAVEARRLPCHGSHPAQSVYGGQGTGPFSWIWSIARKRISWRCSRTLQEVSANRRFMMDDRLRCVRLLNFHNPPLPRVWQHAGVVRQQVGLAPQARRMQEHTAHAPREQEQGRMKLGC